jgi:CRISPR-associated protein Csa1
MYLLSREDMQLMGRQLGPQSRRDPVVEDLRGWNWYRAPLSPVFDAPLTVEEAAGIGCPAGRDLYLHRVLGVPAMPSGEEVREGVLRRAVSLLIHEAKRLVYEHGARAVERILTIDPPPIGQLLDVESPVPAGTVAEVAALWEWERGRFSAAVAEAAAQFPNAPADGLVAAAIPMTVGRWLDGRKLGLAARVEADAVALPGGTVMRLRFGPPTPADRLVTAGLALVLEAAHEHPVDFGCVVEAGFSDGQVTVRRDLYLIDDELRQLFIEARDERARLVQEEIEPAGFDPCNEDCVCRRAGVAAGG